MILYVWNYGRFAWPFVIFIVYCVIGVVIVDFLWRIVKMRSALLVSYISAVWLLGLLAAVGAALYW